MIGVLVRCGGRVPRLTQSVAECAVGFSHAELPPFGQRVPAVELFGERQGDSFEFRRQMGTQIEDQREEEMIDDDVTFARCQEVAVEDGRYLRHQLERKDNEGVVRGEFDRIGSVDVH